MIRDDPKLVSFKHFFARKVVFVKETDAIALFPGGFGTHDEAFESLMASHDRRSSGAYYTPHALVTRVTRAALTQA